jgi:beta-lactam-binding protein with PASTA domain
MARRPVPADLENALAQSPAARERFWALPPEQLDRWVSYVERARFPAARRRRVAETVRRLGGAPAVAETTTTEAQPAAVVALPRETWPAWLLGLAALAALVAFLVWWTQYRDDNGNKGTANAVVVNAKSDVPGVVGIKLEAAQFQLQEANLGVKVIRRDAQKPKGVVVAQAPKGNKSVPQGTVVTLVVSKGKPGVLVPKVVGLAAADAVHQLQTKGLGVQLKQTAAQAAPGTVVAQAPKQGSRAKKGTPVLISVAKGAAAVAVPDVTGQAQQDAVDALQQAGLNANVAQIASSQPAGTVVAQNPAPGNKVQQGASVRINVAKRAAQASTTTTATTTQRTTTTSQPTTTQSSTGNDYRGMRLPKAVQTIAEGRQQVVVQYVASSEPAGVVVANSNAGNRVKLQVSAGAHPQQSTTVPDTTGEDSATAQSDLTDAGFSVLSVQWPVSDPSSDDTVVFQTPAGQAPKGSTIVIYIGSAS